MPLKLLVTVGTKGGKGSGNWGHGGRPGKLGGSTPRAAGGSGFAGWMHQSGSGTPKGSGPGGTFTKQDLIDAGVSKIGKNRLNAREAAAYGVGWMTSHDMHTLSAKTRGKLIIDDYLPNGEKVEGIVTSLGKHHYKVTMKGTNYTKQYMPTN